MCVSQVKCLRCVYVVCVYEAKCLRKQFPLTFFPVFEVQKIENPRVIWQK